MKDIFVDSSMERMEEEESRKSNSPEKLQVPEEIDVKTPYSKQYG